MPFLSVLELLLLSASVERFSVSCMRDFYVRFPTKMPHTRETESLDQCSGIIFIYFFKKMSKVGASFKVLKKSLNFLNLKKE